MKSFGATTKRWLNLHFSEITVKKNYFLNWRNIFGVPICLLFSSKTISKLLSKVDVLNTKIVAVIFHTFCEPYFCVGNDFNLFILQKMLGKRKEEITFIGTPLFSELKSISCSNFTREIEWQMEKRDKERERKEIVRDKQRQKARHNPRSKWFFNDV